MSNFPSHVIFLATSWHDIPNKIRLSVNVTMIEAWEANIGGAERDGAGTGVKSIPLPSAAAAAVF